MSRAISFANFSSVTAVGVVLSIGFSVGAFANPDPSGATQSPNILITTKSNASNEQPPKRVQGDSICYEMNLTPKRSICNYVPKFETAQVLLSRILMAVFDGRQPADPSEAYVRVVGNNQLEFMSTDPAKIDLITDYISHIDILDSFIQRRYVNVNLQIVELVKNSDQNMGFLISGRHNGKAAGPKIEPVSRLAVESIAGLVTSTFAIGNLVNTVLNLSLQNFKEREEISVISTLPFRVTHGFDLSSLVPFSQQVYRPFSIQTITENTGITFQGEARLHRDQPNKILLKNFVASVSQVDPNEVTTEKGPTMGAKTFRAGPVDLVLEAGCSTIIRVLNQIQNSTRKSRNLFFSTNDEKADAARDFLFIIQATGDSLGTPLSTSCGETGLPQAGEAQLTDPPR